MILRLICEQIDLHEIMKQYTWVGVIATILKTPFQSCFGNLMAIFRTEANCELKIVFDSLICSSAIMTDALWGVISF